MGFEVVAQVITMIAHIVRDAMINFSGQFIPQRRGVAICAHRSVSSFPSLQLLACSSVTPERRFQLTELAHRHFRLPVGLPLNITFGEYPMVSRLNEGIVVLIDIHQVVAAENHRIRIKTPYPTKESGMINLEGQGLPPAR